MIMNLFSIKSAVNFMKCVHIINISGSLFSLHTFHKKTPHKIILMRCFLFPCSIPTFQSSTCNTLLNLPVSLTHSQTFLHFSILCSPLHSTSKFNPALVSSPSHKNGFSFTSRNCFIIQFNLFDNSFITW